MTYPAQLNKVKWKKNSPRFAQACFNLGYIDRDLIMVPRSEFNVGDDPRNILKFERHRIVLMKVLNNVIEERNRIRV